MQLSHKPYLTNLPLKQQFSLEASTVRTFTRQDLEDMLAGKSEQVQMIACAKEIFRTSPYASTPPQHTYGDSDSEHEMTSLKRRRRSNTVLSNKK
jgi:hypothetical protein